MAASTQTSDEKNALLFKAIEKGRGRDIQHLYSGGANLEAKKNGRHLLHEAIRLGHPKIVALLLKCGASIEARAEADLLGVDASPLDEAVLLGNAKLVTALLNQGANVNAQGADGHTALHLAALNNNRSLCDVLIAAGASLELEDQTYGTPVSAAFNQNHRALGALLQAKKQEQKRAQSPESSTAHMPVSKDFVLHMKSDNTPEQQAKWDLQLIRAVHLNHGFDLEEALMHDANVNQRDVDGKTPLHHAARSYDGEFMIKWLVKAGADIEAPDRDGNRPLHDAVVMSAQPCVLTLLELGAEVNGTGHNQNTPLHMAVGRTVLNPNYVTTHRYQTSDILLAAGANLQAKNDDGYIPADIAFKEHNLDAGTFLSSIANNAAPRPEPWRVGLRMELRDAALKRKAAPKPYDVINVPFPVLESDARTYNGKVTQPQTIFKN